MEINRELFEKLRQDRLEDKKFYEKPHNKYLLEAFSEMYASSAHFLYELLQNADDAKATEVEIELCDDCLLFTHNGTERFTLTDIATEGEDRTDGCLGHINSIVATAFSSKGGGQHDEKRIGKFGLGFKAVYNYTKTPHIYDDPYCFKIDDGIPELLEDRSRQQKGKTVFYLPFDKEKEEGDSASALNALRQELSNMSHIVPQLFLYHIQHIFWKAGTENGLISKKLEEKYKCPFNWMSAEKYVLETGENGKRHIIMLTGRFNLGETYGVHIVRIAYWLKDDGSIETKQRKPGLYSYFPLNADFQTCYAAHAPFDLTSNRETYKDNEFNQLLICSIGRLAANGLIALKDIGLKQEKKLVDSNIFHLISNNQSRKKSNYWREEEIHDLDNECAPILKKEALFTNRGGDYTTAAEVVWGEDKLQELFSPERLQKLLRKEAVDFADLPNWNKYLSLSGIRTFDDKMLAENLSSQFMAAQDDEWLMEFYQYVLDKKLCDNSRSPLAKAPCVRVKSGKFVGLWNDASKADLYFDDGSDISKDQLIDDQLYASCKPYHDLIDKIGFKQPNELQVLLNRADRANWSDDAGKVLLVDILSFIKQNSLSQVEELKSGLRTKIAIACRQINSPGDTKVYFTSCEKVYVDDGKVSVYFKLAGLPRFFSCWDFYADACSSKNISRKDFENLLLDMGANRRPQWVIETRYGRIGPYGEGREYLEPFGLNESDISLKYNKVTLSLTKLEGLEELFKKLPASNDEEHLQTSRYLWELLCHDCQRSCERKEDFPPKDRLDYVRRRYAREIRHEERDSITELLRNQPWLHIGDDWRSIERGITRDDLEANNYRLEENLIMKLRFQKTPDAISEEEKANLSDEGRENYALGEKARSLGIESEEDMEEAAELLRQKKQKREKTESEPTECGQQYAGSSANATQSRVLTESNFAPNTPPQPSSNSPTKSTNNYRNKDITKGFDDPDLRVQEMEKVVNLREQVAQSEKYTYRWFKACISLEAMSHGSGDDDATTRRSVRIDFGKVSCVEGRDELIELSDTPHRIPDFIEDIDGIEVSFVLSTGDNRKVTFDAASVKHESLFLKASGSAKSFIADIRAHLVHIDLARINMERPVEIINSWKYLILHLPFEDSDSLKGKLGETNLKFIFGPPGTGKTTQVASFIKEQMEKEPGCRILVLAPTNKACDVLAEKIIEVTPQAPHWLWRFVTSMSPCLEEGGYVHGRGETINGLEHLCLISTMARYAFDGLGYGKFPLRTLGWDYVIVDEASMVPLYQIVAPILSSSVSKTIIAGDPFQIMPIVKIEEWEGENIYTMVNLNDFTTLCTEPKQFVVEPLLTQYRSIPEVGNVYSQFSYGGLLKHHRSSANCRALCLGIEAAPLNIISFPVTRQSIFEPKRLAGSNIQIYSAVFAVEFVRYITKHIHEQQLADSISIGVISPYKAEIQAISKMYGECATMYPGIEVIFGTSHGFQGDECDLVVVVANPPASGMVMAHDRTFINNRNNLNVAISRARDYLFVLMPDTSYQHFDQMKAIKRLGKIMMADGNCKSYSSNYIEQLMLGNKAFIEANTFVTSHQMTNVYAITSAKYEVRIDENNIDIMIH